jgi:hypothetical protein
MPFKPGKSKEVIASNIAEMMSSSKRKGKIGNVSVPSRAKAAQVAAAIAYKEAGKSRNA